MQANVRQWCHQACLPRTEKRETRREAKAQTAAQLEKAIEAELLKRLQAGTYGDIYNFPTKQYEAVLDQAEARALPPHILSLVFSRSSVTAAPSCLPVCSFFSTTTVCPIILYST